MRVKIFVKLRPNEHKSNLLKNFTFMRVTGCVGTSLCIFRTLLQEKILHDLPGGGLARHLTDKMIAGVEEL